MDQALMWLWARDFLLAVCWTALLMAPASHRLSWNTARTCAMLLAVCWAVLAWSQFGFAIPTQLWASAWPALIGDSPPAAQIALMRFQAFSLFVASWQVEDGPRHQFRTFG